ncbi:DUF1803 domain-containing protein [Candidatus Enterococcus clewellii]|uniref:DUF1803 domain-containing protein n=1 Tax=Candidatus Enterococcus clewellii TaxID=1834193 RepID=A0AAQ3VSQ3_9ENTE
MTITYYFKHKNQKKLNRLVNDPLFDRIITYFNEHQTEKIILRALKQTFQEKNFEKFLEEMVDFQLIRREERGYSLTLSFFDAAISDKDKQFAEDFTQDMTNQEVDPSYLYGEVLWNRLFESENDYFFGVIDSSDDTQPFFEKHQTGNEQLQFVSIHPKDQQPLDFASYFSVMEATSGEGLPEVYQELQELIGDVDSAYFAAQTYRIVRAVLKNRRIADKRNIFLEAFVMTNGLIKTEKGWQLKAPILQNETITKELDISPYITHYNQVTDTNQRVFEKMQFYSCCMAIILNGKEAFSYLII